MRVPLKGSAFLQRPPGRRWSSVLEAHPEPSHLPTFTDFSFHRSPNGPPVDWQSWKKAPGSIENLLKKLRWDTRVKAGSVLCLVTLGTSFNVSATLAPSLVSVHLHGSIGLSSRREEDLMIRRRKKRRTVGPPGSPDAATLALCDTSPGTRCSRCKAGPLRWESMEGSRCFLRVYARGIRALPSGSSMWPRIPGPMIYVSEHFRPDHSSVYPSP